MYHKQKININLNAMKALSQSPKYTTKKPSNNPNKKWA